MKEKREQDDVEKRIEHIQMVKIPPEVSARLRQRILRDIAMYRIGAAPEDDLEIIQMPPKEIQPCQRGCITPTITKGGG